MSKEQKQKHQNNVNNIWTYFKLFSNASIVDFESVNVNWAKTN